MALPKKTPGRWKTTPAKGKKLRREWFVLDAADHILGRMATQVAIVLMGKHKPTYAPYIDTGDHVIVLNAEKVRMTGKKELVKRYQRFSGYPGGRREIPYATVKRKHPERIVEHAVRLMLPKTTLGDHMYKKLKVYSGPEHRQQAQMPKPFPLKV